MDILKNKVAVITGGGRGIGWGISRCFAQEGAKIVMNGRDPQTLEKAQKLLQQDGCEVRIFSGDISNSGDVQALMDFAVEQFGRIDILVANAGINPVTPFLDISEKEWQDVIDVNLTGTFTCVQRAGRIMKEQGGGRIIIISSVDGNIVVPGEAHYGVSKAGLNYLTKIAAVELIKYGIFVNAIPCGWVDTDLVKEELEDPQKKEYWLEHIPSHSIGTIDEIARVALFLAREDVASFMVGASIVVDGGASLLMNGMNLSWGSDKKNIN